MSSLHKSQAWLRAFLELRGLDGRGGGMLAMRGVRGGVIDAAVEREEKGGIFLVF